MKIKEIYGAVCNAVLWDVTCVWTKHSIHLLCVPYIISVVLLFTGVFAAQYLVRCIQVVLRLYTSPAEILAGFDVDAPCCAFDGERVWTNSRTIIAMMRQANTVDMTRRPPPS